MAPAFDMAVSILKDLGADVAEVELPLHAEVMTAAMITCMGESLAYHYPDVQTRLPEYAKSLRSTHPIGALFSGADFVQAQRVRRIAQRHLTALFEVVDAIVMPAASVVAPDYGRLLSGNAMESLVGVYTVYWDAVGNPALVVPMGFNAERLPLSLQIAARPFAEDVLVQIGDAFQTVTDWHLKLPTILHSDDCDSLA